MPQVPGFRLFNLETVTVRNEHDEYIKSNKNKRNKNYFIKLFQGKKCGRKLGKKTEKGIQINMIRACYK